MVSRVGVYALIALLLAMLVSAEQDLFDAKSLTLDLTLKNSFELVPRSVSYSVQKLSALMSWYPIEDSRQKVDFITTTPGSEFIEGQGFTYSWSKPSEKEFLINQNSRIKTSAEFIPVKKKVPFPMPGVDSELSAYLSPQDIIDITPEIQSLASGIAGEEDDAFIVTTKLANWVEENVKYDLSTTTADASQKASWVLEKKVGVCDELTSLFISMCRSLGIPARFVSGVSYSNVNQLNDGWGPHGWAEVYFPEYGWVPFDVTYKELGFVDAAHIKLRTSPDAKETSVEYSLVGQNADLKAGSLSFDVDVVSKGAPLATPFVVQVTVEGKDVGFGSYNLIMATVNNDRGNYISGKVYLSNVSELTILGNNKVSFVLEPYASQNFYWVVKVSDSLNENYAYTFPVNIYSDSGLESKAEFRASARGVILSEEYVRSRIPDVQEFSKPYSDNLEVACTPYKNSVYLGESVDVACSIKNTAPVTLGLKVCFAKNCTSERMVSGDSKNFVKTVSFTELGVNTLAFRASGISAQKTAYVVIPVLDEPLVSIENLTYPESLDFNQGGEIRFIAKRDSISKPVKVDILLDHELIKHNWSFDALDGNYEMTFLLSGHDLALGKNDFNLSITYRDKTGKEFESSKVFSMELGETSFPQKVFVWFNAIDVKFSRWLESKI